MPPDRASLLHTSHFYTSSLTTHPPLQRTLLKIMAECQNFFDDRSPSACRSSSSADQSPAATRNDCADHGLELRLGPSVDAIKPKQHEMVRPIPLYPSLDKQRSGNSSHAIENSPLFRGHSDVAMADKALSKDSAFTTPPRISREQVWQTLQKTNAVLGQQDAACAPKAFCEDAESSMWGRRSASLQITTPSSEMSELDMCPIRRSCSNGLPISRQSSFSQDTLVDESPGPTNMLSYNQQQEALELQKRREMQAHRRLEARKRRRLLMEEKQQRKARQNRHCIAQMEKDSLVHMRSKDRNCALQAHERTQHEASCAKPGDDEGLKGRYARDNVNNDSGHGNIVKTMMHKDHEINSSGSRHIRNVLSGVQNRVESRDLSVRVMHESSEAGKDADIGRRVKSIPSSCSESESTETKGRNLCGEMDSSEHESSNQKSSSENHLNRSGSPNVPLSKPMPYPRALSRAGSGIPTAHANLVLSSSTQCPLTASGKNDGLQMWHSTSLASKPLDASGDPVSNGFAIKKCVGVFSEGKWKTSDEKLALFPIRRTTSNVVEAATDSQCSAKELENRVSAATSQLKFARMGLDNAADRMPVSHESFACASRLYLNNAVVKKEFDSHIEEQKPLAGLKGPALTQGTPLDMIGSGMCKANVKQEEDMTSFNGLLVSQCHEPNTGSMHSGVINRQRSASFLDLPRVTTTGKGPNGKTINGVMYISSGRSVWLVCRCHGKHMSPAEFVEHSGSTDLSNPLRNIVVNPSPLFNQIATTPV